MAIMSPVLPETLQGLLLERAGAILVDAEIYDAQVSFEEIDESSDDWGMLVIRTSMYSLFSGLYMRDIYNQDQRKARTEIRALCAEMSVKYRADPLGQLGPVETP